MTNVHWKVLSFYWRAVVYDTPFFALILARTNIRVKKHSAVHESWWIKDWSRTWCTVSTILKLKRVVYDHSFVMLFVSPGSPWSFKVSESLHLQIQGIWSFIGFNVRREGDHWGDLDVDGWIILGCIGSWWGNRREGDHWGDLDIDGWIILGCISRRWDVDIWTGLGWPRIETGGGRLWLR